MVRRVLAAGIILGVGAVAFAEMGQGFVGMPSFGVTAAPSIVTRPPSEVRPAPPSASTIWGVPGGVLVIDGDTGQLARVDRDTGRVVDAIAIGPDAGPMFVDAASGRAWVVDRRRDRIVIASTGGALAITGELATRTDPVGIALADGGATVLVTSAADGRLSALEAAGGKERWSVEVGPEPRAVAVSPDGRQALVTLLRASAVAEVDLAAETRAVRHVPLTSAVGGAETFPRAAFAAAYLPDGTAVVPHQVMTPQGSDGEFEDRGSYGGGGRPPVAYLVTFLRSDRRGAANAGVHTPRAIAYDSARDTLYVAGYGSDEVIALADASQASMRARWQRSVGAGCGPDGVAVIGDEIAVHCALTREVQWLDHTAAISTPSKPLGPSRLSPEAQRGRDLFRKGNDPRLSLGGALACESCHPEGGADGLSWRIEGHKLQTPFLGGRIAGTAPYKWDGGDRTLSRSLAGTIRRLGGGGLSKPDLAALSAWIETIERPRAPARPADAVARGKALFAGELGCASCHGGSLMTDGKRHDLADDLARVDTPSLIGLARSAPYYHDGSAETLRSLLLENGSIHMGRLANLSRDHLDDVVSYLETL
jgi:mono/diheme cytochrome c family protein